MLKDYKVAAWMVFSMAWAMSIAGGLGCRTQGRHERWLVSDSTGILYGPVGPVSDSESDLFRIGKDYFHLTSVSADDMAVIKKLLGMKVAVDVRDMDIEDFVELLNAAQKKTGRASETVEIKVAIPESWDTDIGQMVSGKTVPMKARAVLKKISMSCPVEQSIYEILIGLHHVWWPQQFHFMVEGTSVCLKVTDFQRSADFE